VQGRAKLKEALSDCDQFVAERSFMFEQFANSRRSRVEALKFPRLDVVSLGEEWVICRCPIAHLILHSEWMRGSGWRCGLTFELRRERRDGAWPARPMIRTTGSRAKCHAGASRLQRRVRRHCARACLRLARTSRLGSGSSSGSASS